MIQISNPKSETRNPKSAAGSDFEFRISSLGLRLSLRLLLFALLAALLACGAAQDQPKGGPKKDAEEKKPAPAKAEDKKDAPAKAAVARRVSSDEQFDQWVFQQDRNASAGRQRLNSLLTLQVDSIDRTCQVTDAQKKKLQLAGRGDIKRFFDRYETVKRKFQSVNGDQLNGAAAQEQKLQEMWQDIRPLQMTLQAGLFQEDSLLYKSLQHTLTSEQFARYAAVACERREFRHRANIELAATTLEQNMPLRDAQRRELITLLLNQTKPPRRSGPYDTFLIMFQLGRLPEEKLKLIFDDVQWKVVSRHLAQFKGYEQMLRQAGQWPPEDDEADKTDADGAPAKE
jgi:hypothetical protein